MHPSATRITKKVSQRTLYQESQTAVKLHHAYLSESSQQEIKCTSRQPHLI
jgi:hypothetical protein